MNNLKTIKYLHGIDGLGLFLHLYTICITLYTTFLLFGHMDIIIKNLPDSLFILLLYLILIFGVSCISIPETICAIKRMYTKIDVEEYHEKRK